VYGAETIAEGKNLLIQTRGVFNLNQTEDNETSESHSMFKNAKAALENAYRIHRKKARVVFLNEEVILHRLGIDGPVPRAYIKWIETIKKFYTEAADREIQTRLARLKVTPEEIVSGADMVSAVEIARANYLREVGESQDATKAKDDAMAKMENWMSDFYAVARIALEDHPQLLEALGKTVKS
jgi:hypothetical protein